jgi:hypothetical protein
MDPAPNTPAAGVTYEQLMNALKNDLHARPLFPDGWLGWGILLSLIVLLAFVLHSLKPLISCWWAKQKGQAALIEAQYKQQIKKLEEGDAKP